MGTMDTLVEVDCAHSGKPCESNELWEVEEGDGTCLRFRILDPEWDPEAMAGLTHVDGLESKVSAEPYLLELGRVELRLRETIRNSADLRGRGPGGPVRAAEKVVHGVPIPTPE